MLDGKRGALKWGVDFQPNFDIGDEFSLQSCRKQILRKICT
jgi:hypothetical protein